VLCAAFASPPPARPAARHRIDSARLERTGSPSVERHPHQRCDGFPRASARVWSALRLATTCDARCVRPTSASQHIHYEHPRLGRFPGRHAASERAAFHDATSRFGGQGSHRHRGVLCPEPGLSPRLWRSCRVPHPPDPTLVGVSRPSSRRRDRIDHMLRERHAAPATRSTFHRLGPSSSCPPVDRFRPRRAEPDLCRSRDLAITIRRSTPLRSQELTGAAFRQPRLAPVR